MGFDEEVNSGCERGGGQELGVAGERVEARAAAGKGQDQGSGWGQEYERCTCRGRAEWRDVGHGRPFAAVSFKFRSVKLPTEAMQSCSVSCAPEGSRTLFTCLKDSI